MRWELVSGWRSTLIELKGRGMGWGVAEGKPGRGTFEM
jgi:phosphoglycolate phosphatase-like HAD superfamily hydrolase